MPKESDQHVASYYFPQWHVDPKNESWHGEGWTEWELIDRAEPQFEGHDTVEPAWGYEDESDPDAMAKKIDAAADHGIDTFVFDWYWYDGEPFLHRALEEGFLEAENNDRMTFAIFWCNHDWKNWFPVKRPKPPDVLAEGAVSRAEFEAMAEYIIENYFTHDRYWTIDGDPYFSFIELDTLLEGLGSLDETVDALEWFRERTRDAGFADLHLNANVNRAWAIMDMTEAPNAEPSDVMETLGIDSVSSYGWESAFDDDYFPTREYAAVLEAETEVWAEYDAEFEVPYVPSIITGSDSSPRTVQSDTYENVGYPFAPILTENTPAAVEDALAEVDSFVADQADNGIVLLNAWNEWPEGSHFEPGAKYEGGYLEAVDAVFGD